MMCEEPLLSLPLKMGDRVMEVKIFLEGRAIPKEMIIPVQMMTKETLISLMWMGGSNEKV